MLQAPTPTTWPGVLNTGIGYIAARELAKRGYNTVLACRDLQKAQDTKARLL